MCFRIRFVPLTGCFKTDRKSGYSHSSPFFIWSDVTWSDLSPVTHQSLYCCFLDSWLLYWFRGWQLIIGFRCFARSYFSYIPVEASFLTVSCRHEFYRYRACTSLSELRSCVNVEVAVLGSPSLIVLMVSVDVKKHWTWTCNFLSSGAVWKSRWSSWVPRP